VSEAIREDEALATDVDETSEAEVHEASGETDLTEGANSSEAAASSAAEDFERSAAAARESLIAELQRTVDSVSSAVDDATARTFEEAQAEARRQAEAASARVDALERDGLAKLRELADELLERSQWLSNQLAELTQQAQTTASEIRAEDGPAKLVGEDEPVTSTFEESTPPPYEAEVEDFEPETETEEKSGGLGFFRRRKGPDVPEGVRLIISQMRSSGEGDREIVKHLEEMGVKDPEALVSSVKS
jgi:small-conductance mechanosensitive channel